MLLCGDCGVRVVLSVEMFCGVMLLVVMCWSRACVVNVCGDVRVWSRGDVMCGQQLDGQDGFCSAGGRGKREEGRVNRNGGRAGGGRGERTGSEREDRKTRVKEKERERVSL
eukprot:1316386-Rhodomonas_salina.2